MTYLDGTRAESPSSAIAPERALIEELLTRLAGGSPRVGVDLVHVPAVAERVARHGHRWLQDQFTSRELDEISLVRAGGMATIAGRLAAKEAFIKLLAVGDVLVLMRDIQVLRTTSGAPVVQVSGGAARAVAAKALNDWSVSITHQGEWAAAVAYGGANAVSSEIDPNEVEGVLP